MFETDPRLTDPAFFILSWDLCDLYLKDNHNFPWLLLIPRIPNITEIYELSQSDQQQLIAESSKASKALMQYFQPDKINVGALGNIVSQLHIHVIARFKNDAMWPHSLWQDKVPQAPYSSDKAKAICDALRQI